MVFSLWEDIVRQICKKLDIDYDNDNVRYEECGDGIIEIFKDNESVATFTFGSPALVLTRPEQYVNSEIKIGE